MTCIEQRQGEVCSATITKGKYKIDIVIRELRGEDGLECDYKIMFNGKDVKYDSHYFDTVEENLCEVMEEVEVLENFEKLLK